MWLTRTSVGGLNKPEDNTAVHVVEVFAGGTTNHAANVTNEIVGTATYAGPAAGKYVTKTFEAGVHSDSGVGHFTANANLTAKFGADNEAGTIGGSVTGFVLDDTDSVPLESDVGGRHPHHRRDLQWHE